MKMIDWARRIVPRSWRNALRRPGASVRRMAAKLRRKTGGHAELEVAPGWTIRCHPLCVEEFRAFQRDPEQRQELSTFIGHCAPGMRFMDVGAHWGVFTLAALKFGGDAAACLNIEASDAAAAVLADNLALNGVAARVTLINAACGDRPGSLAMLTTGAGGADYFVVPQEERPDSIQVEQVTVDQMAAKHQFAPSHLKIDVEGYEKEVLLGARKVLERHKPAVFLELHGDLIRGRGGDPEEVLGLLSAAGYRRWLTVDGADVSALAIRARGCNVRLIALNDFAAADTMP